MSQNKKRYLHRQLAASVFWTALLFAVAMASFFTEYNRANQRNLVMLTQLLDTMEHTAATGRGSW